MGPPAELESQECARAKSAPQAAPRPATTSRSSAKARGALLVPTPSWRPGIAPPLPGTGPGRRPARVCFRNTPQRVALGAGSGKPSDAPREVPGQAVSCRA
ncbi:unnamed protein product, partial [Ixodes hexagonus]